MAGYPFLAEHGYGATMGYAMPGYDPESPWSNDNGPSHTAFILWLIVYAVVAAAILGGLKIGGFSFVFRTR